jgi:hypothetical protein
MNTHEEALAARLVEWFYKNYEDPAESLPYISQEGGYQWIWGGPWGAEDELRESFPHHSDRVIELAVTDIELEGWEWMKRSAMKEEEEDRFDPPESFDPADPLH